MKIYTSIFIFWCFIPFICSAQIEFPAKTKLLGLNLGGSYLEYSVKNPASYPYYTTTSEYQQINIVAIPEVMYFIYKNIAVGIQNQTYMTWSKSTRDLKYLQSSSFYFGPIVRFYFKNGLFINGGGGRQINSGSYSSTTFNQLFAGLGYCKMVGPKVGIEPTILFQRTNVNPDWYNSQYNGLTNSRSIEFGIGVSIFPR